MGILQRAADILSANINDMLDKCEDPAKMIDQELRKAIKDLAVVKDETADVMATEEQAKRVWEEADAKVKEEHAMALNAMKQGDEDGATKILQREKELKGEAEAALDAYEQAKKNSETMKACYNKLASDIETLKGKKNSIKSKVSVAKATEKVNNFHAPNNNVQAAVDKYEQKANRMLDKANAKAALDTEPKSELDKLHEKYKVGSDVSAELEALKAEAGVE